MQLRKKERSKRRRKQQRLEERSNESYFIIAVLKIEKI